MGRCAAFVIDRPLLDRPRRSATRGLAFLVLLLSSIALPLAAAEGATDSHQHDHAHDHADERDDARTSDQAGSLTSGPARLTGIYCLLIVGASMVGGWLPTLIRLTHTRMQIMISFVGGLMLGIGLLHMLPHAVAELGPDSLDRVVLWILGGLLVMFFLLRTFHFHQHEPIDQDCGDCPDPGHDHDHDHDSPHDHAAQTAAASPLESHQHAHIHDHAHGVHHLSWVGVAVGLSLHTLIDGLALGAAVQADVGHDVFAGLLGLGTFLAVMLHKPLDAVSITSLMVASGWSPLARRCVNLGFALMCPLGAALFLLGVRQFSHVQAEIIGCALGFSAGVFLCISLGDLLPEMEFHSHNRTQLSIALLAGIALAWGIGFLEPEHAHHHNHDTRLDSVPPVEHLSTIGHRACEKAALNLDAGFRHGLEQSPSRLRHET